MSDVNREGTAISIPWKNGGLSVRNYKLKARIIETYGDQTAFARLLGIREDRLSKIIHGRIQPRPEEVERIASLLKVSEEIFLGSDAA